MKKFLSIISTQLVRVTGTSMEPTFPKGVWILVNRRSFSKSNRPKRFDVVRFQEPGHRTRFSIKRIVGLPNEDVHLLDGKLFVDGVLLLERPKPTGSSVSSWHWPSQENHYVVLGDKCWPPNITQIDSRTFGRISDELIRGKVIRKLC